MSGDKDTKGGCVFQMHKESVEHTIHALMGRGDNYDTINRAVFNKALNWIYAMEKTDQEIPKERPLISIPVNVQSLLNKMVFIFISFGEKQAEEFIESNSSPEVYNRYLSNEALK